MTRSMDNISHILLITKHFSLYYNTCTVLPIYYNTYTVLQMEKLLRSVALFLPNQHVSFPVLNKSKRAHYSHTQLMTAGRKRGTDIHS